MVYKQKGTLGIALPQRDMPFTEEGMIPDIIMNTHCFVGETLVSLPNGLSKRIDSFSKQGLEKVLSFNDEGINKSSSVGLESQGIKETIKLTLIDGRELICTPDHKFRILENGKNIWKEAQDITYDDKLLMGFKGVEDIQGNDESEWSLHMGEYAFTMKDDRQRDKSLAFARLLGYICNTNNKCVSRVSMRTMIDANNILDDIQLVTGKRPSISNIKSDFNQSEVYVIALPDNFTLNLAIGRRTTQEASFPEFISTSPKSFIREFIGGLMGGDGWMPHYSSSKQTTFSTVKFSQAICKEFQKSLENKMNLLVELMELIGVKSEIIRTRDCHKKCQSYIDRPRISIELQVKSNSAFHKYIGFRYCTDKALRLEVAAAYENYCEQVKIQHNNMINRVNELIDSTPRNRVDNFNKYLETARTELYKDKKVLNEYYSLLTCNLVENRRKKDRSNNCNVFKYKYMTTAKQFLENCGCLSWFDKENYITQRTNQHVPFYNLSIMKKENYMEKEVFDIGVMTYHAFIANGVAVMNSIPSRMTVGQLVECLASKEAAISGHFVDGTPFCDYNIKEIPEILKKLGYSSHGTEVMYNGLTGKKIETEIFIGPTYQVRLKHMVQDKVHGRARGPRQALTRQPLEGRSRDGGLKIGRTFCLRVRMQIRG